MKYAALIVAMSLWPLSLFPAQGQMQKSDAQGKGPVTTSCKTEIEKYCSDKEHFRGDVRKCLEAIRTDLSQECVAALDSTGPGKGKGKMRQY